jgi:hypothetical protein
VDLVQLSEASSHESFRRMGCELASGSGSKNKILVWLMSRNFLCESAAKVIGNCEMPP